MWVGVGELYIYIQILTMAKKTQTCEREGEEGRKGVGARGERDTCNLFSRDSCNLFGRDTCNLFW